MKILLGSGGIRTPSRVALLHREMGRHFGDVERLLFVPYALADYDDYAKTLREKDLTGGYTLDCIHHHPDPVSAVSNAAGIYVGGGNTFRLLHTLYREGLLEPIRRAVSGGVPYLGISAGSNIAGPTIMTTNDMPIVMPPSFDALGLVDFQINPHYVEGAMYRSVGGEYQRHHGETRDERLHQFHEMNTAPVVGLSEGSFLRVGQEITLVGGSARIFRRGCDPQDVAGDTATVLGEL